MNEIVFNPNAPIAIVDDEEALADFQAELLRLMQYDVNVFYSADACWTQLKQQPQFLRVLITDQNMPGMLGTQLIANIRAVNPEVSVILCTGYSDFVTESNAESFGIDTFLAKPVDAERFLGSVAKYILQPQ